MKKDSRTIKWKIHCSSIAEQVFKLLATDEGRKKFWAERTKEQNGIIHFEFPNGQFYESRIIEKIPLTKFVLVYFDSLVTFELSIAYTDGTNLKVIHEKTGCRSAAAVEKTFRRRFLIIQNPRKILRSTNVYITCNF